MNSNFARFILGGKKVKDSELEIEGSVDSAFRQSLLSYDGVIKPVLDEIMSLRARIFAEQERLGLHQPRDDNKSKEELYVNLTPEELQKKLEIFYSKFNPDRLKEVDKIVQHFDNRLSALNEALILSYGQGIFETADPSRRVAVEAEKEEQEEENPTVDKKMLFELEYKLQNTKELLNCILREKFLSRNDFPIRVLSENDFNGVQQFWLEKIMGTMRADLFRAPIDKLSKNFKSKRSNSQICFASKKPFSLNLTVTGLRTIQKVKSALPSIHNFDRLTLNAEIEIYCLYIFRNKSWKKSPLSKITVTKLKTLKQGVSDKLIQSVINAVLPEVFFSLLLQFLTKELGELIMDDLYDMSEKREGVAVEFDLKIAGAPLESEFHLDLAEDGSKEAARILKALNVNPMQLKHLVKVLHNSHLHSSNVKICLEDMLLLKEHFTEESSRIRLQNSFERLYPNSLQKTLDFVELAQKLEEISELKFSMELKVTGLDLKLNLDRSLSLFRSFLWRKYRSNERSTLSSYERKVLETKLRGIHRFHRSLSNVLQTVKFLFHESKVVLTGSMCGGKYPSYEVCIRDGNLIGVVDANLTLLRAGGDLNRLIEWLGFDTPKAKLVREVQERFQKELSFLRYVCFNILEFFEFYFLVELKTHSMNSQDENSEVLFLSVNGQRQNPRIPLTIHLRTMAKDVFRLALDYSSDDENEMYTETEDVLCSLKQEYSVAFPIRREELISLLTMQVDKADTNRFALFVLKNNAKTERIEEHYFQNLMKISISVANQSRSQSSSDKRINRDRVESEATIESNFSERELHAVVETTTDSSGQGTNVS